LVGGYTVNKMLGDPIGRGFKKVGETGKKIWGKKKSASQSSESFDSTNDEATNETKYNSSDKSDYKEQRSQNENFTKHDDNSFFIQILKLILPQNRI